MPPRVSSIVRRLDPSALSRRDALRVLLAGGLTLGVAERLLALNAVYVRPFGPRAPWNLKVADLPVDPDSASLAQRLFLEEIGPHNSRFQLTIDGHTPAIYDAADAKAPNVVKTFWPGNLTGKIPWNDKWRPGVGHEAQLVILDAANGLEWDLFGVDYRLYVVNAQTANLVPGDYRTNEEGFPGSRGSGIPLLAMITRPQEIAAGVIEHALSMSLTHIHDKEFIPPATKLDYPRGARAGTPVGTRFSLRVSDAEIDAWLTQLPKELSERTRETARIIAVALRDYGWFITDASPGNLIHLESRVTAKDAWAELGLQDQKARRREYPRDLIDGLFTKDRILAYLPSDQYPEPLKARPRPPA